MVKGGGLDGTVFVRFGLGTVNYDQQNCRDQECCDFKVTILDVMDFEKRMGYVEDQETVEGL